MNQIFSIGIQLLLFVLPWPLRRRMLSVIFGYQINANSKIGLSIILSKKLNMAEQSRIGNLNFVNKIDMLDMASDSGIGSLNYVTGYPTSGARHFLHIEARSCSLVMKKGSGITSRHFVDCTCGVEIGELTTIAGVGSVLLTHSIDVRISRQDGGPIRIGKGCFLGARVVVLPGVKIADRVVVGAGSVVHKSISESDALFGSHHLRQLARFDPDELAYAHRARSNVD